MISRDYAFTDFNFRISTIDVSNYKISCNHKHYIKYFKKILVRYTAHILKGKLNWNWF